MSVYLGKNKISITKIVDLEDDLNSELTEQETSLAELEEGVNALKDVSDETLTVNENGEYDVKEYGKIVVRVGERELVVALPETFATATSVYYFATDNDTLLISSDVKYNSGLWVYKISSNTIAQVYNKGHGWRYFQIIGDYCLISGDDTNTGLLSYNISSNSVEQISTKSYHWDKYVQVSDDKWLISGSAVYGILLYKAKDNTILELCSDKGWSFFHKVGNDWLISSSATKSGILLYEVETDNLTKVYELGASFQWGFQIKDKMLLVSSSSSAKGIVLYNSLTKTCTKIYEDGYNWLYSYVFGNKCFLSANRSATDNLGLLLYNYDDDTVIIAYEEGTYGWQHFKTVGDNCLISSGHSNNSGILLYKSSDNSVSKIYDVYQNYKYFHLLGNKCLISSSVIGSGLLVYDINDCTLKQIYNKHHFSIFQTADDNNNCFVSSTYTSGSYLLFYNYADDTVIEAYNASYCDNYYKIGNKWLISSSNVHFGILSFDIDTKTYTIPYTKGGYYDTFVPDNKGGVYISSKKNSSINYTLYYNSDDDTAKLVGYKVEV